MRSKFQDHDVLLQRLEELPVNQRTYWKTYKRVVDLYWRDLKLTEILPDQANDWPERQANAEQFWGLLAEAITTAAAERLSWMTGLQGVAIQVVHLREFKQLTRSTAHSLKSIKLTREPARELTVPVSEPILSSSMVKDSHNLKVSLMGVNWRMRDVHSAFHWFVLECTLKSSKYHFQKSTIYLPKPAWFEALQVVTPAKDLALLIFSYTTLVDQKT